MMDRDQTKVIVRKICAYYPAFADKHAKNLSEIIDGWTEVLADEDFNKIQQNLTLYVRRNKFAPSLSELIAEPEQTKEDIAESGRKAVPNAAETYRIQAEKEKQYMANKLTDEEIEKIREEGRKIIEQIVQRD